MKKVLRFFFLFIGFALYVEGTGSIFNDGAEIGKELFILALVGIFIWIIVGVRSLVSSGIRGGNSVLFAIIGWMFYEWGSKLQAHADIFGYDSTWDGLLKRLGLFIWIVIGISFIANTTYLKRANPIGPKNNAPQKVVEQVDWNAVRKRIKDIKNALDHVYHIHIKSEGEETYAEPVSNGTLRYNLYKYPSFPAWHLETYLDVDEGFARKHASDYVTIAYPYKNLWEEILDNNSGIDVFASSNGAGVWLVCYLSIPNNVSYKQIMEHVGDVLK